MSYLYLPFIIQGILMGVDEQIHMKRGLGTWERLGHPLDTLTVLIPLSYIAFHRYGEGELTAYIIMAIFSCLFITKDEFIHSKECGPMENWLHALLFVLHPLIFLSAGILWKYHPENNFIKYQPVLVLIFMIYQIFRWSIPWKQPTK